MKKIFGNIMKFFELFSAHAETLVLGATALREVLQGGEGVQAACAKVVAHEDGGGEAELGQEVGVHGVGVRARVGRSCAHSSYS